MCALLNAHDLITRALNHCSTYIHIFIDAIFLYCPSRRQRPRNRPLVLRQVELARAHVPMLLRILKWMLRPYLRLRRIHDRWCLLLRGCRRACLALEVCNALVYHRFHAGVAWGYGCWCLLGRQLLLQMLGSSWLRYRVLDVSFTFYSILNLPWRS